MRVFLLIGVIVLAGALALQFGLFSGQPVDVQGASQQSDASRLGIGGPFSLINQDNQLVTEADYEGYYKLIYFGFTFCPEICPTELLKVSDVLDQIAGNEAEKIQPLFITVDPERDTPEVIKAYVTEFHPRLVGLTGTREQVDKVLQDYRIYSLKVDDEQINTPFYTMDHSSFIYLMTPDNRLVSIYRLEDTVEDIAEDITRKVS